ncbi:flagellar motor switch protein FliM [Yoonia maritima]|uniref:Flagellar motor switch protein FliM n=1 Tax=Yoonia maritima TaxID=1435347 RepID=A0A2T0W1Z5_9RHOB|nr:FliM/FliN family flagellar motor C-terminal domain-containing protein [Yoonia maritima]PRY78986.1 flagellar motor switch protein FliM [Yoonia maritima]
MTDETHLSILRRMSGGGDLVVDDSPLTSSRAMRLALAKSANDAVGLILTVNTVTDDILQLDEMLNTIDDTLMLVGVNRNDRLIGVVALDMQLRAAILEMQLMGTLIPREAEQRAPTVTDKTMCGPMLAMLLSSLPGAMPAEEFAGWADNVHADALIESRREVGLMLDDCTYRVLRMNVDLGIADRQSVLTLALPCVSTEEEHATIPPEPVDWSTAFQAAVEDAPASLDALLHRFKMSLGSAQDLEVGQLIPLHGCTVGSVRLLALDGQVVANAKLGQVGGMRAVRIESEITQPMADLNGLPCRSGVAPEPSQGVPKIENAMTADRLPAADTVLNETATVEAGALENS